MQRQLATGQSSILPVNIGAQAPLIQEIFMQVVNFSQFPYLAPLFSPINTLASWLTRSASAKRLVPPANAPLAHQRMTLPFAREGSSNRKLPVGPVSSFKSAVFEAGAGDPAGPRLKVVRELDEAASPTCAGRMMISGRITDVCAELDRMAQREAVL
jgi:hypothetical protein